MSIVDTGWALAARVRIALRHAPQLAALTLALLLGVVNAACSSAPTTTTYTLATLFPQSGAASAVGQALQRGVDLAVKQNATLAKGRLLTVTHERVAADPATTLQAIAKNKQIVGIVGPYDDATAVTLIPLAARNQLTLVSPTNTLPGLTQADAARAEGVDFGALHPAGVAPTYFRLPAGATAQGKAAADLAAAATGSGGFAAQSAFVVDDGSTVSKALASAFTQEFTAKRGRVAGKATITTGTASATTDTQAIVAAIVAAQPDLVYYSGAADGGAALRSALSLSGVPQLPILAGDQVADNPGWASAVGLPAASAATWALLPALDPTTLTSPAAKSFSAAYQAAYPTTALHPETLMAYDAAMVEITALKQLIAQGKAVTRAALSQAVRGTKYTGVTGPIAFDANGDNTAPPAFSLYTCDASGAWRYKANVQP